MNERSAFIALIGAPNVGKSTLVNYLIGQKISIVSPKVQTTYNVIKGILTEDDCQLIFLDCPGMFIPDKKNMLQRKVVKNAWEGVKGADYACLLIDATRGFDKNTKIIIDDLIKHQIEPIIVINKVDAIKKDKLLPILEFINNDDRLDKEKIFVISAKNGDGVEKLKLFLQKIAVNHGFIYDKDDITDAPMKFLASEIVREKIFLNLHQELPYQLRVVNEKYETKDKSVVIHQLIYVKKDAHKHIIIGKKGEMIKKIGTLARHEIEELLGGVKVHLFLYVKTDHGNEFGI